MNFIFVDSDVCLDLLLIREPFYQHSSDIFELAYTNKIKIFVSSVIFANVYYILRQEFKDAKTKDTLIEFKKIVSVLPVGDSIIDRSLHSDFKDFEDGIQYFTALDHHMKLILTRNLRDYKTAKIQVMTPEAYLKTLKA
ncbi:MAG TPA: PIN domain-containing protein [Ohtaekwangia sp.]|uniref:type II toxin-antitoxin system VapC family toxin n=1 Tax=Ohtaekwangia sp. TaxID=2066019 RepID=UPI002F92476E